MYCYRNSLNKLLDETRPHSTLLVHKFIDALLTFQERSFKMALEEILRKGDEAYKKFQLFEIARYKVLRHCGMLDPTHVPAAPGTRTSDPILTTRLESECATCNNRHVELSHNCYLVYYAALPYECEHHLPIRKMFVEDPEDRVLPALILPPDIRRIEPPDMSVSVDGDLEDET